MTVYTLSNHPDLVGILPILFENPESRPICDRDIESVCIVLINTQEYLTECTQLKLIPRKLKYTT